MKNMKNIKPSGKLNPVTEQKITSDNVIYFHL